MNTFLENLPDINFAEKDTATITAEIISIFEKEANRKLFPSDPMRLLLLKFVYVLSMHRSNIDFAGKQNLLRYAQDGFIQNIAALVGVEQSEPRAAVTVLRFRLSTTRPNATLIPIGTRATPGNNIYFATIEAVEIPAGELTTTANARCVQIGHIGNGFLPGQVNRLVDTFSFHYSVENIEETAGGADLENIETLRSRTQMAPESFSSAGPAGAYKYWAMTANQLIIDVSVTSPSPGVVEIIPLLQRGEFPTQAILDEVYAVCNTDTRRPLTDYVVVRSPEAALYKLNLKYFISRNNSVMGVKIQKSVVQAIQAFILWQKSILGRDINPSQLTKMIVKAGAKRVEIIEPVFTPLKHFELGVADIDDISFDEFYGGLEDD